MLKPGPQRILVKMSKQLIIGQRKTGSKSISINQSGRQEASASKLMSSQCFLFSEVVVG